MKKQYYALDYAKLLLAYIVVFNHIFLSWGGSENVTLLSMLGVNIAVPLFFCISGFLFFKKNKLYISSASDFIQYGKRFLIIYLFWTAILFVFRIPDIIVIGHSVEAIVVYLIKYIRVVVLIGEYQLWYLIGTIQALIMFYFLRRKRNITIITIATVMFFIQFLENVFVGWRDNIEVLNLLFKGYYAIFGTMRNGIFIGFTYMTLGWVIAEKEERLVRCNNTWKMISAVVALLITVYLYLTANSLLDSAMVAILIPIVICMLMIWLIGYNKDIAEKEMEIRNMSIIIYLSHMPILLALKPIVSSYKGKYLVGVVAVTLVAWVILKVSEKMKIIRKII